MKQIGISWRLLLGFMCSQVRTIFSYKKAVTGPGIKIFVHGPKGGVLNLVMM